MAGLMYAFQGKPKGIYELPIYISEKEHFPYEHREAYGALGWETCTLAQRTGSGHTKFGYFKEEQTWNKAHNGDYWIGWWNEFPPTPKDMERKRILPGHEVLLEDDNLWVIPCARAVNPEFHLSKVLSYDEDGETVQSISPRYKDLWDIGERFWNCTLVEIGEALPEGEEAKPIAQDEFLSMACSVLRYNYFLGEAEVSVLGLISTVNFREITDAVIDMSSVLELMADLQKKTDSPQPE